MACSKSRCESVVRVMITALAMTLAACSEDSATLHKGDLAATQEALEGNHPGARGGAGGVFAASANAGLAAAEVRGADVADRVGHFYSLAAYATAFRDTHVAVTPTFALPDELGDSIPIPRRHGSSGGNRYAVTLFYRIACASHSWNDEAT